MDFGTRLKKLRTEKNLSQEELATHLGIARSSIANYETNRNLPTTDILNKLATILNCSIDFLLGKTEQNLLTLTNLGLDMNDYVPPTEEQKKQIRQFAEFILKENKKKSDI